jgi:serine/threonine protein kinase
MGGSNKSDDFNCNFCTNRVWKSKNGVKWELLEDAAGTAEWPERSRAVTLVANHSGKGGEPTILLIGGLFKQKSALLRYRDVYSTKDGRNWTRMCANQGVGGCAWANRFSFGAVAIPNNLEKPELGDHVVLMGGAAFKGGAFRDRSYTNYADVWRSTDGAVWTKVIDVAPWGAREGFALLQRQQSIYLMGGVRTQANPDVKLFNDIWTSADGGITWSSPGQKLATWSARAYFSTLLLSNDLLVLIGGSHAVHPIEAFDEVWVASFGGSNGTDVVDWFQLGAAPWGKRVNFAATIQEGAVMLMGGTVEASEVPLALAVTGNVGDGALTAPTNAPSDCRDDTWRANVLKSPLHPTAPPSPPSPGPSPRKRGFHPGRVVIAGGAAVVLLLALGFWRQKRESASKNDSKFRDKYNSWDSASQYDSDSMDGSGRAALIARTGAKDRGSGGLLSSLSALLVGESRSAAAANAAADNAAANEKQERFRPNPLRRKEQKLNNPFSLLPAELMISPADLEIGPRIAAGTMGQVFQGTFSGSTEVAIKELLNIRDVSAFYDEMKILKQLRHPHVVTLYGVSMIYNKAQALEQDPFVRILLVTEFAPDSIRGVLDAIQSSFTNGDIQLQSAAVISRGSNRSSSTNGSSSESGGKTNRSSSSSSSTSRERLQEFMRERGKGGGKGGILQRPRLVAAEDEDIDGASVGESPRGGRRPSSTCESHDGEFFTSALTGQEYEKDYAASGKDNGGGKRPGKLPPRPKSSSKKRSAEDASAAAAARAARAAAIRFLDPKVLRRVMTEIASGMAFIHNRGVIHRDLKPSNLLLGHHQEVKICDFSISRHLKSDLVEATMTGQQGSPRYMAPEVILAERTRYSNKIDVFSFAITLYECVCGGQDPYGGLTSFEIMEGVTHHELRPIIPDTWPASLGELLERCWISDSAERPSFAAIVRTLEEGQIDFPSETVESEVFKNSVMNSLPF